MKKVLAASLVVFALALGTFLLSAPAKAQEPIRPSSNAMLQGQAALPQANPNDPNESQTFTGKITKSGDKLVLTDATGKMVYQLDDQIKAWEFLHKNVKVTGVLDASTKMIRVSAIEPL